MANYEATRYNFDGGDLTGILIIPMTPMIEQSKQAIVKPNWVLPMGSPEVLKRSPNIFTIAQQKLFRKLEIISYSLVRNPLFLLSFTFALNNSTTVSSSRCLRKSAFASISSS